MNDLDNDREDDGSGHKKYVERRVAIEELTDDELITELVERERLKTVTAKRTVAVSTLDKEGFLRAMTVRLAWDIGEYLVNANDIAEEFYYDIMDRTNTYTAQIIVLTKIREDGH